MLFCKVWSGLSFLRLIIGVFWSSQAPHCSLWIYQTVYVDIFANCLIDFLLFFQPQDGPCPFYWGLPLPNVVGSQQQLQDILLNKESAHATSWVNCLITFGLLKNRKRHIKHLSPQPFLKSWCEYWLNYSTALHFEHNCFLKQLNLKNMCDCQNIFQDFLDYDPPWP